MTSTFTVCATGPSLTQEDVTKAYERSRVIAVNDAYRLLPEQGRGSDLYAADPHWWQHHIDAILKHYEGTCWTQDRNWGKGVADEYGLKVMRSQEAAGLSRVPGLLHTGGNSGYQAINLAYHLGATRIILLGFDMSRENGRGHWFGEHPKGFNSQTRYEKFIDAFNTIKPADYGIEILNCSRRTALTMFPCHTLAEAL